MPNIKSVLKLLCILFVALSFTSWLDNNTFFYIAFGFAGLHEFIVARECFKENKRTLGYVSIGVGIFIYVGIFYDAFLK